MKNKDNYVFNILNNCDERILENGQYISIENIKEIEKFKNSLLIAPAGAGKTTSIINLAREDKTTTRVLSVPTTAIVNQLLVKYGSTEEFKVYYAFSNGKGKMYENGDTTIENADFFIITYDQAHIIDKIKRENEIIVFIDEAHEFNSFKSISKEKRNNILRLQENNDIKKVYITATPMNLEDAFDKKIKYKGFCNKNITFVNIEEKFTNGIIEEIISSSANGKSLVYINNVNKMNRISEYLNEYGLTCDCIHSNNKEEEYENLLNNNTGVDVIFCTKLLNIGFDINNIFSTVIYADEKTDVNAIFQFINRERQHAEFKIISKNQENYKIKNINTVTENEFSEAFNGLLTNEEKLIFDNSIAVINGKLVYDNNFVIENKLKMLSFNNEDIIDVMKSLYICVEEMNINKFTSEDSRTIDLGYNKKNIEKLTDFINNESIEDIINIYNSENLDKIMREYQLPAIIRKNMYFNLKMLNSQLSYIKGDEDFSISSYNDSDKEIINSFFKIENIINSSNFKTLKIANDKNNEVLNSVLESVRNGIENEDIEDMITLFNENGLLVNKKVWSTKNFKNNIESITGLKFQSKRKVKNGKKISYYKNITFYQNEVVKKLSMYNEKI